MNARSILLVLTLVLVLTAGAWAQGLPTAKPEQVGLSSERLDRITQMIRADGLLKNLVMQALVE